jgi:hypothetical protein
VQGAELKEVVMEMIERRLQREIYGITTGQQRTFEACLQDKQLCATTMNAVERVTMIYLT